MPSRHLLFVLAAAAVIPDTTRAAASATPDITFRVYDSAAMNPAEKRKALAVAARTLAAAAVAADWHECDRDSMECALSRPVDGELIVRLVRLPEKKPSAWLCLGDAYIDREGGGVLATVYVDRVEMLAAASGVDAATLLGRAIAHELGHLLLATNAHSSGGLMRAVWSRDDVRRDLNWGFTRDEAAAIRARLAARADAE